VSRKRIVATVLAKAKKYRKLTRMIDDRETVQRILGLTEELKQTALALAKPDEDRIRIRAREISDENADHPGGTKRFGIRPNGNFGTRKIWRFMPTKIPD
jgi:hypothetical protein